MPYTAADKRKAVEREISMRKRVYPNRIETGRMTQAQASYQIVIFEEIADDYRRLEQGERLL
jgi:hypothetical protein